jgi:2-polyprenyl-6-hydroxyphenyl methylase/3-demethylubiquinone-9 3-methyltransferase
MNHHAASTNLAEVDKFNELASHWWDKNGPLKTLHDINPCRLQYIIDYCGDLMNQRILDVGCGGGILSESMAREGAHVLGIDLAQELIQVARLHAIDQKVSYLDYQVQDVIKWSNQYPGTYDVVTCMELLEHVPNPQCIIEACANLLRSGGFLYLSTLNRHPISYLKAVLAAEYLLRIVPIGTHDYQSMIRPSELASMLRDAGVDILSIDGMDYNPWLRKAIRSKDVRVNYLIVAQKP